MKKLAIITTHPIQYYAPVFKLLGGSEQLEISVYYTRGNSAMQQPDPGFQQLISWDIPLLEGYSYQWVKHRDLIAQVANWQPDALLVYGWPFKGHLKCLRFFKNKIPIYFRGDSTLLNEPKGLKKLLRKLYLSWVYKHVDHAFYVGSHNKAYFKKYGLKDHQLSFAPHAIDNTRFEDEQESSVKGLRSSLNIGKDEILILYAGKFDPVKNVDLLLSAFINMNNPTAHLLLVGNGVEEENLKQQAQKSTLSANIHFIGFQNQSHMPVFYQAADLFCLPSSSETWGLAVNEAMACSKAILVSDKVGCAVDLVKDGYNGWTFKAQSLTSLTQHLEKSVHQGKNELAQMGANSKQIINHWTFQKQVNAIESAVIKHG
ncbi:Glycosyltransferase involved in cell wall bisynthesis [Pedobacter sp. ok626]|uniref:glycosyltransferase family 4 protein n=1 Tax=Pedobacter sp. ok626 TaxID=1761882 RepID=UPI000883DB3F|nr:glycosyltransferase family 4 protein [Pedobacter sp. ok626]SDJ31414.1 Glycosyltransferase involved in cell wall bisynthesis [Pedobacter sp. ok626]